MQQQASTVEALMQEGYQPPAEEFGFPRIFQFLRLNGAVSERVTY